VHLLSAAGQDGILDMRQFSVHLSAMVFKEFIKRHVKDVRRGCPEPDKSEHLCPLEVILIYAHSFGGCHGMSPAY
jgi:hypothetical protein